MIHCTLRYVTEELVSQVEKYVQLQPGSIYVYPGYNLFLRRLLKCGIFMISVYINSREFNNNCTFFG